VIKEFRKFILKGDIVEIAVGLILALAFKAVIDALTNGIIMQVVAAILGKPDFFNVTIGLGDSEILIGAFINQCVTFVIVGFVLFLIIKAYNSAKEKMYKSADEDDVPEDIALLREIRDALQTKS
jgi:large conductance mechanosensitive channel